MPVFQTVGNHDHDFGAHKKFINSPVDELPGMQKRTFKRWLSTLPYGMTTAKLKQLHSSVPVNPILAVPAFMAGIQRLHKDDSSF